ncbi:MAG: D-glycerate dehydrogenase [Rhodoferax sp.]|nr:D-glycerate dehydrogenase [Rhodoferax sp.]
MSADRFRVFVARAIFPEVLDKLGRHFEVQSNQADRLMTPEEMRACLQGASGVFTTGSERVDAPLLAACPSLRICANMAVGYNNFDLPAMTAAGVLGTNAPDVLTETTADFGFALMLAAARRISESERFLRAGLWERWRYDLFAGADVHGKTMGILGMGRIGRALARRGARGFGMRVVYHNRNRLNPDLEEESAAQYLPLDGLLREADHLLVVLPYSESTHHRIGAAELRCMKPTATLVNIGRGGVVDDSALVQALRSGQIAAAGLDVFEGEPRLNPGLLDLPNVVLTPHIASASQPTRLAMAHLAADNLIGYLTLGKPLTPLNPEVLVVR